MSLNIISFFADLCMLGITIYITYLTFWVKLRVVNIENIYSEKGDGFKIVLENKSLSPIIIKELFLIIDGKYKVKIDIDDFMIIEARKAVSIINKFSYTVPKLPESQNINILININGEIKSIYDKKNISKITSEIKKAIPNVSVVTNFYNGKIVPEKAKYVLGVYLTSIKKTIFILDGGLMSDDIFGYNFIPKDIMGCEEKTKIFLEEFLNKRGIKQYHFEKIIK